MAGFMNRMYFGNPNKGDLKKSDVKKESRVKLFFTVLQVRFWKLIQLNLMYAVFLLPALIVLYINYMPVLTASSDVDITLFTQLLTTAGFRTSLMLLPCLVFAGPATAGVTYVLRNWARDEHAWVWSDFIDAMKKNWKQALLIMLINGLVIILFFFNIQFYAAQEATFVFLMLKFFALAVAFVYASMNMLIFPMMVTYELGVKSLFKNALIIAIAELPKTILFFAVSTLWIAVAVFYSFSFLIPALVIGFTFPLLLTVSFANYTMEKYMQPAAEPSQTE